MGLASKWDLHLMKYFAFEKAKKCTLRSVLIFNGVYTDAISMGLEDTAQRLKVNAELDDLDSITWDEFQALSVDTAICLVKNEDFEYESNLAKHVLRYGMKNSVVKKSIESKINFY